MNRLKNFLFFLFKWHNNCLNKRGKFKKEKKMKEIVLKNFTSKDRKIKNISVTEIIKNKDLLIESSRNTIYSGNPSVKENSRLSNVKPQIYVTKNIDTKNNTKKYEFKIKGRELKSYKEKIYPVDYEHSFTVEIVNLKNTKTKKGN
jgi:hypothetical protein